MIEISKVKGTRDYFGKDADILNLSVEKIMDVALKYGLELITFPILEYAELFNRSVGEETDIVAKEMFLFKDKKERKIVLRPEGTSSVVRMLLENKLLEGNVKKNYFYIEKMFRYERPQKGRQREFFQFGVESFNESHYLKDVEIIFLGIDILKKFNIKDFKLELNYLGSKETRIKYKEALKKYLEKDVSLLSEDSKKRFKTNILRILDSKDINDQKLLKNAPKLIDFLSMEEKDNFLKIQNELRENNISFELNSKLVRGLDYYNNLVFEFVSTDKENIGNQNTIIGGGRYDDLINIFDKKKEVPAIGFALGLERLISASPIMNEKFVSKIEILYLLAKDENYDKYLTKISLALRKEFNVLIKYNSNKNLTKRIADAKKNDATFVGIIGEKFEQNNTIEIKNLITNDTNFKKIN